MNGTRVQLRLPNDLYQTVCKAASDRRVSINALAISALEEFCGAKSGDGSEELTRRLIGIERKTRELALDVETLGELFSLFVYHWFCYTPPIPEAQKTAILLDGKERHEKFLRLLEKRLRRGEMSLSFLLRPDSDPPAKNNSVETE